MSSGDISECDSFNYWEKIVRTPNLKVIKKSNQIMKMCQKG